MAHPPPELSVIIPCYRDAPHLRKNVETILKVLRGMRQSFELILVNDASPDNCREIIQEMVAEHPVEIRFVDHLTNTGRGRAVADGLEAAAGRLAGFLDIDLEVPAHYIAPMVQRLEEGADVVCAHRVYRRNISLIHRAVMSRGYAFLLRNMLGEDLGDTEAGFKFFRRDRIMPVVAQCQDPGWFWDTEIMVRAALAGLRIDYIPVLFLRNPDKASTVRIVKDSIDYWKRLVPFRKEVARLRRTGKA